MDTSLTPPVLVTPTDAPAAQPAVDLGELKSAAEKALHDAKEKLDALLKDGQEYIKAHPGKSILAAVGAGFVLGMIFKD
jgi:ElaB/YqjD/DUF883 family membrane-anchored ribosome-binding protein